MIKASIYKIVNQTTGLIYIGSTINSLNKRLSGHIMNYKKIKSGANVSKITSYKVLHGGDYYIELIKMIETDNRKEVLREEGNIIKQLKEQYNHLVVNKVIAGRTEKEYCKDMSEHRTKTATEYNIKNAEKYKEYQRQYRLNKKNKLQTTH
jgi:hypothetical protein